MKRFISVFDKYTKVKLLWQNKMGEVCLVKHISLEVFRVIKVINKEHSISNRMMWEAHILRNLCHPGIPIIYDIEEDDDNIYIIEEYISGESLKSYISNNRNISDRELLTHFVHLCEIVNYLHSLEPHGVLHLDIKPDNILVSEDGIRLIDFGNSIYKGQRADMCVGTKGFAATEQYCSTVLDERADIYGLGAVLLYMFTQDTGVDAIDTICDRHIKKVITKCLKDNPRERYKSVKELIGDIETIYNNTNRQLSLSIAVIGAKRGAGATYVALRLVKQLRTVGINAIYEEHNNSKDMAKLLEYHKAVLNHEGMCTIRGCPVKPEFNHAVNVNNVKKYNVYVCDYGAYTADMELSADIVLMICGNAEYDIAGAKNVIDVLAKKCRLVCIVNHADSPDIILRSRLEYGEVFGINERNINRKLGTVVFRLIHPDCNGSIKNVWRRMCESISMEVFEKKKDRKKAQDNIHNGCM